MKILVINGPNLDRLGERKPKVYGQKRLEDINQEILKLARQMVVEVDFFQSNHEGDSIDKLNEAKDYDGLIINPGALTHYSYALRDALEMLTIPVIEVHISNILAREDFRKHSVTAEVCSGVMIGFGWQVYLYALEIICKLVKSKSDN